MTSFVKFLTFLSFCLLVSSETLEKCGKQVTGYGGIPNGTYAKTGEYPWSALIEYKKDLSDKVLLLCGGILIDHSYVLTAAHCVTGLSVKKYTPINVRLGDHDINNEGPDCTKDVPKDCTDGAVSIPIYNIRVHPEYTAESRRPNIALIQLNKSAPYTDFIRPICLPSEDFIQTASAGFPLQAVGWQQEDEPSGSRIKKHFVMPYLPLKDCKQAYTKTKISITEGQLCAGGQGVCGSQLGTPVMVEKEGTTSLVGMFSFGPNNCTGVPDVFTNVFKYVDWIKANMDYTRVTALSGLNW